MKAIFRPRLVNGPFEDPVLYVDFQYERRALLFDIGTIRSLTPRQLLRLTHVFVSHTHMDHFADFDWLLRISVGREMRLRLFGPPGFIDRVEHKLAAYSWNLVANYDVDLVLEVTEVHSQWAGRQARFRCLNAFRREEERAMAWTDGIIVDAPHFRVRADVLDHQIPSIAYAVEEKQHLNVCKDRLETMGLDTGPWLGALKHAVLEGEADDTPIDVAWKDEAPRQEKTLPLGRLKDEVLEQAPGKKIAYVVDCAHTPENVAKIVGLIRGADIVYMEAAFLEADAAKAGRRHHLTARQAGSIARRAGVEQLQPLHFSPRYGDCGEALVEEALSAFRGEA